MKVATFFCSLLMCGIAQAEVHQSVTQHSPRETSKKTFIHGKIKTLEGKVFLADSDMLWAHPKRLGVLPLPDKLSPTYQHIFLNSINQMADKHGVERALVHAFIAATSGYQPYAVSEFKEVGILPLRHAVQRRLRLSNPYDVEKNLDAGIGYIKQLQNEFKTPQKTAIAFFAGEFATRRYRQRPIPPYWEVRILTARFMHYLRYFRHKPLFISHSES